MKRLNRFILSVMGACALALGACTDDVPSDDFGKSPAVTGEGVYFPNTMSTTQLLGESSEPAEVTTKTGSFVLPVARTNAEDAATVEVTAEMDATAAAVFTVPSSVSFEAGEAETTLEISYVEAQRGVSYQLVLSFADATEYAYSKQTITALYPALEVWTPIKTTSVYIDQLFSMLQNSDGSSAGDKKFEVVVEKLEGKNMYRFLSPYNEDVVAPIFPADFEPPYIVLDGETYRPLKEDGTEYADGECPLEETNWFIAGTKLGFKMDGNVNFEYDLSWNTFGSMAYNTTADPEEYPLGTYNKSKQMFDFGSCYHNIDGVGIYPIEGFQLWLDDTKMEVVYDRDYAPWSEEPVTSGTFYSEIVDASYVVTVSQGTLPEGETGDPIYRFNSLYAEGVNIAFFQNPETNAVRVPKGQLTGLDAFGNDVYMDVSRATYDAATSTYTFEADFYIKDEEGTKTVLNSTTETFRAGYFETTLDDLQGQSIDAYCGTYDVTFTDLSSGASTVLPVVVAKEDESTLVTTGLAPYAYQAYGYEPNLRLAYDAESGLLQLESQQVNDLQGDEIIAAPANTSTMQMSTKAVFVGGMNADGNLEFLNVEANGSDFNTIFFTAGNSIIDLFVCGLVWMPATEVSQSKAMLSSPLQTLKAEKVVRHFTPKFTRPANSGNAKVMKSLTLDTPLLGFELRK